MKYGGSWYCKHDAVVDAGELKRIDLGCPDDCDNLQPEEWKRELYEKEKGDE